MNHELLLHLAQVGIEHGEQTTVYLDRKTRKQIDSLAKKLSIPPTRMIRGLLTYTLSTNAADLVELTGISTVGTGANTQ